VALCVKSDELGQGPPIGGPGVRSVAGWSTSVSVEPTRRYTSYPARPLPPVSLDAIPDRVAPMVVMFDATGVPGVDGAVMSDVDGVGRHARSLRKLGALP
jgi:hypothetical protein